MAGAPRTHSRAIASIACSTVWIFSTCCSCGSRVWSSSSRCPSTPPRQAIVGGNGGGGAGVATASASAGEARAHLAVLRERLLALGLARCLELLHHGRVRQREDA